MNGNIEAPTIPQVSSSSIGVSLWITFGICFLGNIMGGVVSTLMSVYLPEVVTSLLGNTNDALHQVSAYINALYVLGWAVGGFMWGIISDKIGRVKSLAWSVGCYGLFTWLISITYLWELVVVFRLLSGFCVGGTLVISTTYLSEIWPQRSRAIIIGILSIGFPVGIFSAGLINYLVSDWRQGFMIGWIPLTLGVISVWMLKESEQWKTFRAGASDNKPLKHTREYSRNLIRGSIIFGTMVIGLWAIFSWLPTWVQSLLDGSDGQTERSLTMMLLGAGGLSGGFFSGWIANALGVRKAMLLCFSGCILMSVLLFGLNTTFSNIIYVEIVCLAMFFGISQGLLSGYIPQLFPVSIRARSTGFCFNLGRMVTAIIVFFVGALVNTLGGYGNSLLIFSSVFLIGWITIFFFQDKSSVTDKTIHV